MKILFDYQAFDMQNFGGISRYFYELINYYQSDENIKWELPIIYSGNEYLRQLDQVKGKLQPKISTAASFNNFLWGAHFKGKKYLFDIKNRMVPDKATVQTEANKQASVEKLKKGDFDVFHPTFYDDYFLNYIGSKPYILTVYDLNNQIFPEFHMYDARDKNKKLLDAAARIISISESTKSDLINIFNVDEKKIIVTHLANSLQPASITVSDDFKKKIPAGFLLFVGNRDGYKNFLFFAQVVAALNDKGYNLNVVCTGPPFNKKELFFLNKLGAAKNFHQIFVNDNELTYLYKNAIAFVFPTMYEGFGIPALEAFSCGCPVLVSHNSSLPEVCGDAAVYFEPKHSASMAKAIASMMDDRALRQDHINRGFEQLKKFSWQATAAQTLDIYKQVVTPR